MAIQKFATIVGVIYLLAGLMGFVPRFVMDVPVDSPHLMVNSGYGYLLGLFPINLLHNFVHLTIGALGILAARTVAAARSFSRGLAFFYGALAILGLIPGFNTTFGLIPIYGHDVWLHALPAAMASYYGFGWTDTATTFNSESRRAA